MVPYKKIDKDKFKTQITSRSNIYHTFQKAHQYRNRENSNQGLYGVLYNYLLKKFEYINVTTYEFLLAEKL